VQAVRCLTDCSDERRGVSCGDAIDRHMERLDGLAAEIGVQPIDERRPAARDRP